LDVSQLDKGDGDANPTHAAIMKWLNSSVKFIDYYEQVILSRLMYLTSYGICYPTPNRYNHMNAFLLHDKETTLKYSKRWEMSERFMNLSVYESTGISLDSFFEKTRYETDRIFEMCERKLKRNNAGVDGIRKSLENLGGE
jgi:hypothetical protein